jgi:hypothetical protein
MRKQVILKFQADLSAEHSVRSCDEKYSFLS